jgi:hypothetical protein
MQLVSVINMAETNIKVPIGFPISLIAGNFADRAGKWLKIFRFIVSILNDWELNLLTFKRSGYLLLA